MSQTLTLGGLLVAFLLRGRRERARAVVAYDDPQRDPNYCWTHHMIWPTCEGMH